MVIVCKRRGYSYELKEIIELLFHKMTDDPMNNKDVKKVGHRAFRGWATPGTGWAVVSHCGTSCGGPWEKVNRLEVSADPEWASWAGQAASAPQLGWVSLLCRPLVTVALPRARPLRDRPALPAPLSLNLPEAGHHGVTAPQEGD